MKSIQREWGGFEICYVVIDSVAFIQQIYCSFLRMDGAYVYEFLKSWTKYLEQNREIQ